MTIMTFQGVVIQSEHTKLPNETRTPAPYSSSPTPHPPPALRLLSNSTADYLRGPLSTRLIPGVYMLSVAVGTPANAAILCALAAKVRTVSSAILYCSLAISDLLLLLSLFFKAHYHLHGNDWVLGETACRAVTACFYGNLYCSAFTLACVSVKRYLAVVHPFLYKCLPKRMLTAWASLAVWTLFVVAMVPELLVQQSYRLPQLGLTTCHDVLPLDYNYHSALLYYNLGLTLLGLLLPLVVSVTCSARVVFELRHSHHDWALYIKASTLVLVIFLVCFTPAGALHFLHYVRLLTGGEEHFYGYFNVSVCLCSLHACLDPFLFLIMSKAVGYKHYSMSVKGMTATLST
ncbi:proteinase-activated receptor 3-like [Aplochiton taeniatus]